jgi:hypothetical protein
MLRAGYDPLVVEDQESGGVSTAALGIGFIVVGLALLAVQLLDIDVGEVGWPLFVIVPGVVLLVIGLLGRGAAGMTIGGCAVTAVGLLLLYQNASDHWESWAYAWALVGPGAFGLGLTVAGLRSGDAGMVRNGTWQGLAGLGIFAAGLVFFEGIIGISGRRLPLPDWSLAALIIAVGVALLVRTAVTRQSAE